MLMAWAWGAGELDGALVGPTAEPGTIILDEELTVVAATSAVWTWIDLLGLRMPGAVEPLPASIRAVATQAAQARARARGEESPAGAKACLQAADGRWAAVHAVPLVGAAGGYVITLDAARSQDLALRDSVA
jgi:hypothetical protein